MRFYTVSFNLYVEHPLSKEEELKVANALEPSLVSFGAKLCETTERSYIIGELSMEVCETKHETHN